jgi:photosystem II stability/assembly factor-like uncharacterized protein
MISNTTLSASVKDLHTVILEAVQHPRTEVAQSKAIGFDTDAAMVFVTFNEPFNGESTLSYANRTVVVKTLDGGVIWRETLQTYGKAIIDETFCLDSNHFWLISQWQIAGTFPTLYWTTDFGETWQESKAVEDFLRSKGHITVNFAEGIRFQDESDGVIIARPHDGNPEGKIYFLQTQDAGKTWKEIPELPDWYSEASGVDWQEESLWTVDDNGDEFTVTKPVGSFPRSLKP